MTAYNAIAIMLGLGVGLALVAYAGGNVGEALSTLFLNPVTTSFGVQQIFVRFVVFYTMAMGIGLALKAGLWNIGAQGQLIIAMMMAFLVFKYLGILPWEIVYVLMVLVAVIGGLLWIVVPTVLRVKFGANEIVVTLLLNVVAMNVGAYILNGPLNSAGNLGYPTTVVLPAKFRIPDMVGGVPITYAVPLTVAIGLALYFLVERTPFRIKADTVGESVETAAYAGINITRVMVVTMLAAGALAGLAGASFLMGFHYHIDLGVYTYPLGFIAVIAALVGRKHMIGIGIASLFFGYITIGAESMATQSNLDYSVVVAMEGVMMVGILVGTYFAERGESK